MCSKVPNISTYTIYGYSVVVKASWVTRGRVASLLPCVGGDKDLLIDGRSEGELVSCAYFTANVFKLAWTVFCVIIENEPVISEQT